jgi:hypothetical protein
MIKKTAQTKSKFCKHGEYFYEDYKIHIKQMYVDNKKFWEEQIAYFDTKRTAWKMKKKLERDTQTAR